MATQALDIEDRDMSIGRVFERAFGVMGAEPLTVFGIAFLFGQLPQLISNYALAGWKAGVGMSHGPAMVAANFVSLAISVLLIMLVQGALVRATVDHSEGRSAGFGRSCITGLQTLFPMLGLAVISMLGIMGASLLLLVPGIMLYMMWNVASPALVEERLGVFGSLARSRYLTKGARWKIFGINLMLMVVIWMISIAAVLIFGIAGLAAMALHPSPAYLAISAISGTVVTGFWATMQSSLFVELRNWKEGAAPEQLAEVFA